MRLGVVIITKDQAWNVERLLDSVAAEAPGAPVVLVDSASADDTVAVAARHPIDVLRLDEGQQLTAAAGRAVGAAAVPDVDLVLFLDGDMELVPGWLGAAVATLDAHPGVAAVSGEIADRPREAREPARAPAPAAEGPALIDVPHTGGVALHRRAVLDAVGGFTPHLRSDEEPELCVRIRHAGHRVVRLRRPAVWHYTDPAGSLGTLVGRWRRGLYLGAGQAIRHNLGGAALVPYVRERGYGLVPGVALAAGAALVVRGAATGRWAALQGWVALVVAVPGADIVRRRSPRATAHSLLERLFILDGTVRGFARRPPDTPPIRHAVVRRAAEETS